MEPGTADLNLEAIEVPRAADVLANQLRKRILDGGLSPGTWLPSERELTEQSGLSRGTVRNAIRVLEHEGLVEKKLGRNGGTRVCEPDGSSVQRTLETFIRGRRIRFRSLLEIRELLEPECAALAAERRDEEDLGRLEGLSARLRAQTDDIPAFLTTNASWHLAIAEASHNELLVAFMRAISQEVRAATDIDGFNSKMVIRQALVAHEKILDAIQDGDPEGARRRMDRHVRAYREMVGTDPGQPFLGDSSEWAAPSSA